MNMAAAPAPALRCENLVKTYSVAGVHSVWRLFLGLKEPETHAAIPALKGVSLTVPRGKIVGILGNNGAGKSTLLRVLGGVYPATSGLIETRGSMVGLFELGGMGNPNLTGREYAERYLRFMGASAGELGHLLADICAFSELGEFFDRRIRTYSSGMAARLYFATATALRHDIYLIDELLSVGDEHFQVKCWTRLRQLLLQGASGVLVTHDWTAILKLCEYAYVLHQGSFSFEGPSDKAVVHYLGLRAPEATIARFAADNPARFVVKAVVGDALALTVELLQDVAVNCSYSIETMRIGTGWEIVLLSAPHGVGTEAGRYRLEIPTGDLPLVPGRYTLNVFLSKAHNGELLDVRSWTFGTAFELTIEGQQSTAVVRLPHRIRRYEETVA